MATAKATKTSVSKKVSEDINVEVKATEVKQEVKAEPKKYEQEDMIPCRSIISGALYIEGARSGFLYSWADYDDVIEVEFRDLDYMIRSNDKNIYDPRIVVEDEELIAKYPKLEEVYTALYSVDDLKEILDMTPSNMRVYIDKLPKGAKEALKGIASTQISIGKLDSVSRIKTLDEIFGTQMLLTLAQE